MTDDSRRMQTMTLDRPCPCGSQIPYGTCCGRFHRGGQVATTAEELMKSRYAAFATGNIDYLIATHHPSKRTAEERTSLIKTCKDTAWLELNIVDSQQGSAADSEGIVEFIARYESLTGLGSQIGMLRERSRFVKENGQWFYLDGIQDDGRVRGRNEPCWCGSGKKFKKCHARM